MSSLPALITLEFTVSNPIATNHGYSPITRRSDVSRPMMFMKTEAKRFKRAIAEAGLAARARTDWPTDLLRVSHARLSYQLYEYKGDTDGPRKLVRDALEGVLWDKDDVVADGPADLAIADGLGRRVVVTVELLAVRSAAETQRLHEKRLKAQLARQLRPRPARDALDGLPLHLRRLIEHVQAGKST